MTRLTLVVDERELSTIRAALLLLQEEINALPEDLAEMMSEHGPPMTERELGKFAQRLAAHQERQVVIDRVRPARRLIEVDCSPGATVTLT